MIGTVDVFLATAAAGALGGLVIVAGLLVGARRWSGAPALAPAYGLLALGLTAIPVFGAWLVGPLVGVVVSWSVVAAATTVLVVRIRTHGLRSAWSAARRGVPLAVVTAALLLGSVGMLLLWRTDLGTFALATVRFSHPLPVDGQIPALVAERLVAGLDPRVAVPGWLSSDRPQLQTGLLLFAHGVFGDLLPAAAIDAGASMAAQSTWVVGAWCVVRAMRFGRRASVLGLVLAGTSGSILVNTVFTWPKLLSAAFVLGALALAVHERGARPTGRSRLPEILVLLALGLLSHGAAVFAAPIVVLALGRPRAAALRSLPLALTAAAAVYAPWWAYQRFYDPPGDRLLSMHLAGVPEPTEASFLGDLTGAYAALDWSTLLSNKLANLTFPFGTAPWAPFQGDWVEPTVRATQFFTTSGALAVAWVPLALVVLAAASVGRGRSRFRSAGPVVAVLVGCLTSLVLWALLMFGPATTYVHQGSHVPLILASVLPTAWLATRSTPLAVLLALAQTAWTGVLYVSGESVPGTPTDIDGVALGVLVLSLVALVVVVGLTDDPPAETDAAAAEPATATEPAAGHPPTQPIPATLRRPSPAGATGSRDVA